MNLTFSNFRRIYNIVLPIILLIYYRLSFFLEFCIRDIVDKAVSDKVYLSILGFVIFITYIGVSLMLSTIEMKQGAFESMGLDKRGMTIHLFLSITLLFSIQIVKMYSRSIVVPAIIFVSLHIINLFIPFVVVAIVRSKIQNITLLDIIRGGLERFKDFEFRVVASRKDYIIMIFVSAAIIGSTSCFLVKIKAI